MNNVQRLNVYILITFAHRIVTEKSGIVEVVVRYNVNGYEPKINRAQMIKSMFMVYGTRYKT